MKISEIITKLEQFAPCELAEEWDNVGLMVGNAGAECTGVISVLDLTLDAIKQAVKKDCNLIVTHHPFIFGGLKNIDLSTAKGRAIELLIKNNICVYSMHTNLDKCAGGINEVLAQKLCGSGTPQHVGAGVVVSIKQTTLSEYAKLISEVLGDKSIKVVGSSQKKIKTVFIVSGSGGSEYELAKKSADVLVTGDLKHHHYIDAAEDGFALIEYSHFASEIIMQDILTAQLSPMRVRVSGVRQNSPFRLLEEL